MFVLNDGNVILFCKQRNRVVEEKVLEFKLKFLCILVVLHSRTTIFIIAHEAF